MTLGGGHSDPTGKELGRNISGPFPFPSGNPSFVTQVVERVEVDWEGQAPGPGALPLGSQGFALPKLHPNVLLFPHPNLVSLLL